MKGSLYPGKETLPSVGKFPAAAATASIEDLPPTLYRSPLHHQGRSAREVPAAACGGWSNKDGWVVETRISSCFDQQHLRAPELRTKKPAAGRFSVAAARGSFSFRRRLAASAKKKKTSARIFLWMPCCRNAGGQRSSEPYPLLLKSPN